MFLAPRQHVLAINTPWIKRGHTRMKGWIGRSVCSKICKIRCKKLKYSGFWKNEYLFWMNILDFYKMNNFLNKYLGFNFPASKMVVTKCLKLIWNHTGIISGTFFSPFQGIYYLYRGLGGLWSHILALFWNFEWFSLFFFNE